MTVAAGVGADEDRVVTVEHLRKSYRVGHRMLRAVDDVSFSILRGETFGLVGESGSGKSTIARCVLRMTSIDGGTVRYRGADVYAMSAGVLRQARRRMQVVFQDPYSSLNRSHDVEGIVGSPLAAYHVGSREARRSRVADLLEMVGISPQLARRRPASCRGVRRNVSPSHVLSR